MEHLEHAPSTISRDNRPYRGSGLTSLFHLFRSFRSPYGTEQGISLIPVDEEHFTVTVRVAMSRQFLGWIMSLGEGIRIVSPDNVVEQMKEEIRRLSHDYEV